jgi:hypothetical protein
MTTRRWMIAVAIAATLLAVRAHLSHVADQYRARAERHESQSFELSRERWWSGSLDEHTNISIGSGAVGAEELGGRDLAMVLWHERLSKKYRIAARRPWFPVPPDPD